MNSLCDISVYDISCFILQLLFAGLLFLGSEGKDEQEQDLSSLQKELDSELEPEMFEEAVDSDRHKEIDLLQEVGSNNYTHTNDNLVLIYLVTE